MIEQLNIKFDAAKLNPEEYDIYRHLKRGRNNAVSVSSLSSLTGMADVVIRKIIRHLIMEHNMLIASNVHQPPGFFVPETADELHIATRSLRHRGIMILMRAAKLHKISIVEIFNQTIMDFKETLNL